MLFRSSFAVISDRFGGDPKDPKAAGTAALLSNGGYVGTYESDKVLIDSQPGDPVEMCLASIPVDCPPGDERGRWYDISTPVPACPMPSTRAEALDLDHEARMRKSPGSLRGFQLVTTDVPLSSDNDPT